MLPTSIASFPLRILSITSILLALVGLFVIAGNSLVSSASIDPVIVVQGSLTNGATHTGVIQVGGTETWTIDATANDRLTISVGEVSGNGFSPRLRLQDPNGVSLSDSSGTNAEDISVRVTVTGTYTVLVSNEFPGSQVGSASYILTVVKTPGPYTISSGDEGGPLTNGATHTGVISVGDLDTWTIQATANDRVTVSVGEVTGSGFSPRLQLQDPNGVSLNDSSGTNAEDVSVRVTATGTYTVLVSNIFPDSQSGNASYVLTAVKTPGPYTISSGDEGGPLTNGATHTGVISVGDLDTWTIQATANDRVTVSVGEVSGSGFSPRLRLQDPNGVSLNDSSGTNAQDLSVRVTATGTYTVLVSNIFPDSQSGNASYMLTAVKTPGPYTISSGDEGGPLTNGATHTGVISVGDLDTWTIQATANDRVTVSVGEVTGSGFSPRLRLQDPNGVSLSDSSGTNAEDFSLQVTATGTYTVLVSNIFPDSQSGNASYILTAVKTPGPYTISSGDEGGPVTNGATHTGVISVGDLDTWTIQATANDRVTVSVGEVSGSGFSPRLRLQDPNGVSLSDSSGTNADDIGVRVTATGTYTVLVSNIFPDSQSGNASYVLTVAKTPGPYTISSGDQGGRLTNGVQAGGINVGDLDPWTFQATVNDNITVTLGEVSGNGFSPRLRLQDPNGASLGDTSGTNAAEISVHVPVTGTYTVLVSNQFPDSQVGTADYTLTFVGPPQPPPMQFSSASYSVGEGDGKVNLTITRSGSTSGPASVNFATSDNAGLVNCNVANGVASAKCDYINALGTIEFAAGETSKTIAILIVDDSYLEGPETFNVTLSNGSGATLGTPSTATITINDNDSAAGPNPADQARFFVQENYYDFLGRYPDLAGWDFWTSQITSCGADQQCTEVRRINVSASFFLSIEFQDTGYLVERIYKSAHGDADGISTFGGSHTLKVPIVRLNEFLADSQEIGKGVVVLQTGWEQLLENNKNSYAAGFVQRSRFVSAFPTTMTPVEFVDKLFQNTGVSPSPADRNAAIAEFGSATNTSDVAARGRALRRVAENGTLKQQESNRAFVLMQYFGYLRRNPNDPQDSDYTGFDFWLTKLNQFNGNYINAEMVKAFISSIEYRQRFGP